MDVTVIIVNYNTVALSVECIQSVYQHTHKNTFEIIVIDNASADQSLREIAQLYPNIRFIFNEQNLGFGPANNQGISIANGKYIFLLNSDTLLTSDAISAFFDYMEMPSRHKVACCGGDLIKPDGSRQISFGNFPTIVEAISALGFCLFYKRYFDRDISSGVFNYSDQIKKVDYICGADMFIRTQVLKTIGAFDEDFFLYFEDTELSFRMVEAGYDLMLIPEVKIIHFESASTDKNGFNYEKLIFYAKSRKLFFNKCYGKLSAVMVNKIYAIQAMIFFFVKWKSWYFRSAMILFRL